MNIFETYANNIEIIIIGITTAFMGGVLSTMFIGGYVRLRNGVYNFFSRKSNKKERIIVRTIVENNFGDIEKFRV